MKSKLHPVYIIIGLFLFKVGIIDNFRFNHTNNATPERRVANIEESRRVVR